MMSTGNLVSDLWDKTMADMYIPNDDIIHKFTSSEDYNFGWIVWTLNLLNKLIKIQQRVIAEPTNKETLF